MTDPEKTEDVEERVEHDDVLEALKWFRRKAERAPVGGAPMPDRLIEEREQVVTRFLSQKEETIRTLRERLEVQDEKLSELCDCGDHAAPAMFCPVHDTENWRNVEDDYSRLARELHAARRRADQLEGAVREVLARIENVRFRDDDGLLTDEAISLRDRLRSALDSREDEGGAWRNVECGACGARPGEPCLDICDTEGCDCPVHDE